MKIALLDTFYIKSAIDRQKKVAHHFWWLPSPEGRWYFNRQPYRLLGNRSHKIHRIAVMHSYQSHVE